MVGMFWAQKYMMVSGLTLVIRKLFRLKGKKDMWGSALIFGMSVISMNLGAGLLYPYTRNQYLFGIAEGIFAGNAVVLLWMIGKRLFVKKKKRKKEEETSPGEERIFRYTSAFQNLAKAFLSVPSGPIYAVAGMEDYQKIHTIWNARMEEQRVAVASQLTEVSGIMEGAVRRAYETKEDTSMERQLKRQLRPRGILLKKVYVYDNSEKRKEVYLTLKAKKKKCISNKEAAEVLSNVMGIPMMPSREARSFVRNEYTNTCFVERTNFEVVYGVERCIGDYQQTVFLFFIKRKEYFLQVCPMVWGLD